MCRKIQAGAQAGVQSKCWCNREAYRTVKVIASECSTVCCSGFAGLSIVCSKSSAAAASPPAWLIRGLGRGRRGRAQRRPDCQYRPTSARRRPPASSCAAQRTVQGGLHRTRCQPGCRPRPRGPARGGARGPMVHDHCSVGSMVHEIGLWTQARIYGNMCNPSLKGNKIVLQYYYLLHTISLFTTMYRSESCSADQNFDRTYQKIGQDAWGTCMG